MVKLLPHMNLGITCHRVNFNMFTTLTELVRWAFEPDKKNLYYSASEIPGTV